MTNEINFFCQDELRATPYTHWLTKDKIQEILVECTQNTDCSGDNITDAFGHDVDYRFQCSPVQWQVPKWFKTQVEQYNSTAPAWDIVLGNHSAADHCVPTDTIIGRRCTCYKGMGWLGPSCAAMSNWTYGILAARILLVMYLLLVLMYTILVYRNIRQRTTTQQRKVNTWRDMFNHQVVVMTFSVAMIIVNVISHVELTILTMSPKETLLAIPPVLTFAKIAIAYICFAVLNMLEALKLLDCVPTVSSGSSRIRPAQQPAVDDDRTSSGPTCSMKSAMALVNPKLELKLKLGALFMKLRVAKGVIRVVLVVMIVLICYSMATKGHNSINTIVTLLMPFLLTTGLAFWIGSYLLQHESKKYLPATNSTNATNEERIVLRVLQVIVRSFTLMNRLLFMSCFSILLRSVFGEDYPQYNQLEFMAATAASTSLPVVIVRSWQRALDIKQGRDHSWAKSTYDKRTIRGAPTIEESDCGTLTT